MAKGSKLSKLDQLAKNRGTTVDALLEEATYDSVAAGICTNPDCDYDTNVEPDQDHGYCENCKTQTVKSCLMLAGII